MGETTGIAWCDATWNPWQGCHKVSEGCKNCYMFRDKKRYGQDPNTVVRSADATFCKPLTWAKNREKYASINRVFTCSWSDFFIPEADGKANPLPLIGKPADPFLAPPPGLAGGHVVRSVSPGLSIRTIVFP